MYRVYVIAGDNALFNIEIIFKYNTTFFFIPV